MKCKLLRLHTDHNGHCLQQQQYERREARNSQFAECLPILNFGGLKFKDSLSMRIATDLATS